MDDHPITIVPVADPRADEGALSCTHDADGRKVCVRRAPGRPPRDLSSR